YRGLREGEIFESYEVKDLVVKRDAGTFTFRSGRISFLSPVMSRVVKAVFVGEGEFALVPVPPLERDYLRTVTERETVEEAFSKAAFCFTDGTYEEIKAKSQPASEPSGARDLLGDFYKRVRDRARGGDNVEAEILADIYNSQRAGFFSAYIFGRKYDDLRYGVFPLGAIPRLAPEEVVLVNANSSDEKRGIWYLAHLADEYKNGTASSEENKHIIDVEHYQIETVIDGGEKLTSSAELTFTALSNGDRVLGFGLLPYLRVTRVRAADDREINFIQERSNQDGSFYAILPEPLVKGRQYKLAIEYQGNKVIEDAGGGNFAIGARTSWYPSINSFNDRATFDITFKVPKQYTLVGVGKEVKNWKEGDFAASQWVSEVPLAVAGFNYGLFKKKELTDSVTGYKIEGYATPNVPGYLKAAAEEISLSPSRMIDGTMVDAQNSMRIFTHWFGEAPYGRIAITQQPQPNFGQSWPTLVYLPLIAYLDSTQRWMLLGNQASLTAFIQEVTAHEVAHQWWGHIVGWASYHDQWLSEGFASFSASIFLQATERKPDKYLKFWDNERKTILEKNRWGNRPNDAGPIWMGLRLSTFKNPGGYSQLVYPKGAYILHMLRWMMFDRQDGDKRFIEMMKDFVKTHFNRNAFTESFKRVVERHMKPTMDLDGNGRMDWFFNQWVYGMEIPSYKFNYTLTPESEGKALLKGTITQSGVSANFKMLVPLYLDYKGKIIRLGEAKMVGSSTMSEFSIRLSERPDKVLINANHDILAFESVSNKK
ncbi:MAG: hypothetical protein L0229_10390, partial [Blastocatellia bacterium]|nr:hypothetical protein [Blastocatellia bacterium]